MSQTLLRASAPPADDAATSAALRVATIAGPLLTGGTAVAAAWAGVAQQVRLPHWWGPWPWRTDGTRDGYVVAGIVLLGALCALWTWLAAAVLCNRGRPRARGVVAVAAACAVPLAVGGPVGSLDVQSYAAIGRLAGIGLDPYRAPTGLLGDRFSAAVDPLWRWTPTPYGPLQVTLFRWLVAAAGAEHVGVAVLLIRATAVLGLVAAVALAARAAGTSGRVPILVVTALNPVVLVHIVSGAHLDVLIGLLALIVVTTTRRDRPGLAMILAVAACAIKLPGVVLVAFVLMDVVRRTPAGDRVRALVRTSGCALGATAAAVLLFRDPFGWVRALSVPGIVHNGAAPSTWVSFLVGGLTDSLVGPGLESDFTFGRAATGAVGLALVVVLLWRGAATGPARHAFWGVGWALVAVAVTGPSLYPWYLTWGLFAAAVGSGRRGRFLLVALSSASCIAAALAQGPVVTASWLAVLLAVLGLTGWLARTWLAKPFESAPPSRRAVTPAAAHRGRASAKEHIVRSGSPQELFRSMSSDDERVCAMPASPAAATGSGGSPGARPVIDVVVPVHNEEADLEPCLRRLHAHLSAELPYPFRITVAENASTDGTVFVARRVAAELPGIDVLELPEPGRGRALRTAWLRSDAPVLVYMDVDLSTDLAALLPLVAPLISGHSDLAVGTRLSRNSRVIRGPKREFISRTYNLLLRGTLASGLSDAQCGFKAIRADVAARLLPLVEDTGWFFDTELLVIAERAGLRIHEVPVDWIDDPDSRVDIVKTAKADLAGIARMLRALMSGRLPIAELRAQIGRQPLPDPVPGVPPGLVTQLVRFAIIGLFSTLAYLAIFLILRSAVTAQGANLIALLITAVANTAANRRLTFGIRGRGDVARQQFQGLLVFALGLALTSGALALLHHLAPEPSRTAEILFLVVANGLATLLRFVLFRGWVFRPRRRTRVADAVVQMEAAG
jgi:putative flippase GtrA